MPLKSIYSPSPMPITLFSLPPISKHTDKKQNTHARAHTHKKCEFAGRCTFEGVVTTAAVHPKLGQTRPLLHLHDDLVAGHHAILRVFRRLLPRHHEMLETRPEVEGHVTGSEGM